VGSSQCFVTVAVDKGLLETLKTRQQRLCASTPSNPNMSLAEGAVARAAGTVTAASWFNFELLLRCLTVVPTSPLTEASL
jgi:hypothetical protein